MRRYISVFGNIILITRGAYVSSKNNDLEPSNIKNVNIITVPNYKRPNKILNYFKIRKIIEKEVKKSDFIIARTSSLAFIAIKYAKKYRKPYLVEVVGCSFDSYWNHSNLGKIIALYAFYIQKKAVKKAPYVVYVTNKFLQKRYPTNGKSVNCSNVVLNEFDDKVIEKRLRKIKNMEKINKIIIGTTAAVNVKYKGQQHIIQALGKLKEEGITNYKYQLVGGGDQKYLKYIAKKYGVAEQAKFLGSLPHDEVFKWLDSIDIYIQPSRQEGLPRALIEAMSRGLPSFGARTGGIPELLEEKYIFSNTRRNITEICNILKSFNKDTMIRQAKRNYTESKKYDKNIIEEQRRRFFIKFIEYAKGFYK